MTELEQLRADLATLEAARKIGGLLEMTRAYIDGERDSLKERIAALEAQQAQADMWAVAKDSIALWLAYPSLETSGRKEVAQYVRHLEAKVAELENELRCERIDGGKVRDDWKAISAEKNRENLAELTTILNAIPPACGEAMELMKRRIDNVKKEMQG